MADPKQSYYDILKVTRDAPTELIKSAFRIISKQYHPDKNPGDSESTRIQRELIMIRDILLNPEKRAKYDLENPIDALGDANERLSNLEESSIAMKRRLDYLLAMHEEAVQKPRGAEMPKHPATDEYFCGNSPETLKSWLK